MLDSDCTLLAGNSWTRVGETMSESVFSDVVLDLEC